MFLWGSFVTSKEVPNDLDVLLVMGSEFAIEAVRHRRTSYLTMSKRASVSRRMSFGPKPLIGPQVLHLWLDTYQTGKDFTRRGIVEVIVT